MKRIIALMMAVLLFAVSAVSAAAEAVAETKMGQMASVSMDETQFRTLSTDGTFSRSSYRSFNGEEVIHKNGYYYTYLSEIFGELGVAVYDAAGSGMTEVENGEFQKELNVTMFNGLAYDGPEMEQRWSEVSTQALAGLWCYRYDKPLESDRYSNRIYCTLSYYYSPETGKVTSATLILFFFEHEAFDEAYLTARDDKIDEIVAAAEQKDSAYEALKYVHDYLAKNAYYDSAALSMGIHTARHYLAHNAFGVLVTGRGVCESYAEAFKEICDRLSFPLICALMYSGTHMWNAVRLDGKWYAVDVTWDDLDNIKEVRYDYFLCGDPDVLDGENDAHTPETSYTRAPQYAATAYDPEKPAVHTCVPIIEQRQEPTFDKEGHTEFAYCGICHGVMWEPETLPKSVSTLFINAARGRVDLGWTIANGAAGYVVYRSVAGGDWEELARTEYLSYVDPDPLFSVPCRYAVQPYRDDVYGEWSYADEVTLTLAVPTVTSYTVATGVAVDWSGVRGAKSYRVYRRAYSDGKWSGWKTLGIVKSISYTDKTAVSGTQYQYTVRAQNGDAMSAYKAGATLCYLAQPTVSSANAANGVSVSWNKITGAASYRVYRRTYSGGKWSGWKTLGTVAATSYTDKTAVSGTQYQYTVRAQNGDAMSAYKAGATLRYLAQPTVTSANAAVGVTVKWNKITGAASYRVYRRTYSGGKWSGWQTLGTVAATSYTDKTAVSGTQYQYTVRAQSGTAISTYKAGATLKRLAQPSVTVKKATMGFTASWNKVAGATGYRVYRRTYSGGKWSGWQTLKNTTALSYTDKTAKAGVQYQYTVRAYSGSVMSSYQASATVKR